ncbi:MAG TPA: Lrp/AsnC family transcriptional regulator [Actinomycetota bacterium]|nr:Lrp/AsnC family transcriptional regulator [Actinomycetota bacterium]
MDDKDRKILELLRADGRLGYAEIGAAVGLAPSSVHDRVRKLERAGIIRGYRADVDLKQAGFPITAIVSLALTPGSPTDIPGKVAELPLVESCYSIAGDNSYALMIRAPSTEDLEALLDTLRAKLEVNTRATIVLSTPFEHRPVKA